MQRAKVIVLTLVFLLTSFLFLTQSSPARADLAAQIPTGSVPTVTSTPLGAYITVKSGEQDQINLRAGPSSVYYDIVGVLVVGQQVPALGVSSGGDWIQVAYPGAPGGVAWVYEPLITVSGSLPIIDPPPTPTPRVTPTIDPTLAAQFLIEVPPTRLPTYTPAPPISIPTFPAEASAATTDRVPMGMLIVGMAALGLFGMLISFLRGR